MQNLIHFLKVTLANEHGSFFDSYKDIMVLWSFAVISFMFLCVSFLRSLGIKALSETKRKFFSIAKAKLYDK